MAYTKLDNRGSANDFMGTLAIIVIVIIVIIAFARCGSSQNRARNYGGDMEIVLEAGEKLEEITWKEDDLWYLTRPMREDEEPETHVFKADTVFGVWEGSVTIIETAKE